MKRTGALVEDDMRNMSDPESRAFWLHVDRVARETDKWPPWLLGVAEPTVDTPEWHAYIKSLRAKKKRKR